MRQTLHITGQDVARLLDCVREISAFMSGTPFPLRVAAAIHRLVPSDVTTYNLVDGAAGSISCLCEPAGSIPPGLQEVFRCHVREHPLITDSLQGAIGGATKVSDLLTPSEFHKLGIYGEFFRPMRIEDQFAITVPLQSPLVIGVAIVRSSRSFTEADRELLDLARPHLIDAFRTDAAMVDLAGQNAGLERALDVASAAMLLFACDGGLVHATPPARVWLAEYFPGSRGLPAELDAWIRRARAERHALPHPRAAFVVERPERRLTARMVPDLPDGHWLVVLDEQVLSFPPSALKPLGLSPRECEVLACVAAGKTNADVAVLLGISVGTVKKHMEHIFDRLGVETRSAAVVRALDVLRAAPARS
jgi:DNA-binding CsgD family transcriptional regulator